MTETWDCAETRISLGVYVLGAIDPAERAQVDAHLATCRDCRDELAGLAGIPALLARVGPEEIARIEAEEAAAGPPPRPEEAPAELIATVHSLTAARQRRSRWRYVAAAAAAVAIIGGVVGGVSAVSSPGTPAIAFDPHVQGAWDSAQGSNGTTGATLDVKYGNAMWGTAVAAQTSGIAQNVTCKMLALLSNGKTEWVASWTTAPDEGMAWYWGSMAASTNATVTGFEVVSSSGQVLVTANAD